MGSFQSYYQSPSATSSSEGITQENSDISLSSRRRKSKRFLIKVRRQSSKSDLIAQTSNAIDLNKSRAAQNPGEGENQHRDHDLPSADLGEQDECKQMTLRVNDYRWLSLLLLRRNNIRTERRRGIGKKQPRSKHTNKR